MFCIFSPKIFGYANAITCDEVTSILTLSSFFLRCDGDDDDAGYGDALVVTEGACSQESEIDGLSSGGSSFSKKC